MREPVLLKVSNVGKRFPGVLALDNVSLSVGRGEVKEVNFAVTAREFTAEGGGPRGP